MTTITEETVRALAGFRGVDAPVTTCYLDVDGRHLPTHREVQQSFGSLVRHAGLNGHTHPSVVQDVQRMERHIRGLKRARARGIALSELVPRARSLEEAFMELTADSVDYLAGERS